MRSVTALTSQLVCRVELVVSTGVRRQLTDEGSTFRIVLEIRDPTSTVPLSVNETIRNAYAFKLREALKDELNVNITADANVVSVQK